MTLSVLAADGRPVEIAQPARGDVGDDDALLSFLALQLMDAPAGYYLVQSTDARNGIDGAVWIVIAAAGKDVGPAGEQIAWEVGGDTDANRRQARQARECLALSARHGVERAEFEATGELPDPVGDPSGILHRARRQLDAIEREAVQRAASAPHDAASDVRSTAQLAHDLLDGYRWPLPPAPGAPRPERGSDESRLAEYFEQLACGDGHTLAERALAATVATGYRTAEATEAGREHGDETVAALDRIATALETLVGFAEDVPSPRPGVWRRAWRAVTGSGPKVEPCIARAGLCRCPACSKGR